MSEQEQKPLEFWLNKMKLFWTLHGGLEKWDNRTGINVCLYCRYHSKESLGCRADKQALRVKPDLNTIYEQNDFEYHYRDTWCAEWIKDV